MDSKRVYQLPLFFLSLYGVLRLLAMWLVPLTDSTEARYGEIARKMVETNDWITPWYDYGVPFWGKPPLSTWLSAASMKLFGINEFAARFPNFLLAIAVLYLVWHFSKPYQEELKRWLSLIILSSMALFVVSAGMVETDMALLFSCTLALISFWYSAVNENKGWGYVFFMAIGLCMLAKGPAAVVLATLPIFLWLLWTNNWQRLSRLPWLVGIPVSLAIFVPWYVMAEIKTPGFIDYFIVGEHIKRFLEPGWSGDRYGHAHSEAIGTIWLFLIVDALPWLAIAGAFGLRKKWKSQPVTTSNTLTPLILKKYLWCWFMTPLLFFTFAHNIILTYTLTGLPALALLLSNYLQPIAIGQNGLRKWTYVAGLFAPVLLSGVIVDSLLHPDMGKKSAKAITAIYNQQQHVENERLNYIGNRLYSMDFYNQGREKRFEYINDFLADKTACQNPYVVINDKQLSKIDEKSLAMFEKVGATQRYYLFKLKPVFCK